MSDVHYTGSPNKYNTVTAYAQIMWSSEMWYHTASSFRLKVNGCIRVCGQIKCDVAVKFLELFYCRHSCTLTGYPRDHLPSCPVTLPIFGKFMKLLFQSNPQHCCHVFMNVLLVLQSLSHHGEEMHITENQNWGIIGMFLYNIFLP